MNYFKLRYQQLLIFLRIKKTLSYKIKRLIIKKIPTKTHYCYKETKTFYLCPFFYINKIKNGDCCLYNPKWMFWKWNGFKDLSFCLDDQCKICNVKRL